MTDKTVLKGRFVIRRIRNGQVVQESSGENLVVHAGKILVASILRDADDIPAYMAVGDSTDSPAEGQTDLQGTEFSRVLFSDTEQDENVLTYTALFDGSWTGTIEEAGIFNAATGGSMLSRWLTGTFEKFSGDSIEIVWALEIG